jgi:signal transduction histidine kinase
MPDQYPEIYTQFLAISLIISFLIGFVVLLTFSYQKRKMQQKKELELLKVTMENEILSTRMEIQETVQRDISMEIHDNVGQTLLLTNVNLTILISQMVQDPSALQLVQESRELLQKSMEDLTYLSRSMNPDRIVEIGVFNAIVYELENLKRKNIVNSTLEIDESITIKLDLKPEIQLLLFRIYQEAIKNMLKYSGASEVDFKLIRTDNGVEMSIRDNGKGFDQSQEGLRHGIGLSNMKKRVSIFNGSFLIQSEPGMGTLVQVFIPVDQFNSK